MPPTVHDLLMLYRPLSQLAGMAVRHEIEARRKDGRLKSADLPVQIRLFRILWPKNGNAVVEINDEVNLKAQVKVRRQVDAGEPLYLKDIDTSHCYLVPPEIGGQRVAFFLGASLYLSFFTFFDFTPNAPGEPEPTLMPYPVEEILNAVNLAERIKPKVTFEKLALADWPPGREYYPSILLRFVDGSLAPESKAFGDEVASRYDEEHWALWNGFWEETKLFPKRLPYVVDATRKYIAADYIGAIRVIAPEYEGIIREHLIACGVKPSHRQAECLMQFRRLIISREFMFFPTGILELILKFIERDLMRNTDQITSPEQQVNRHGVAHGVFSGFETRDIALKYLVLLDALAFVVFHDRMITGNL